MRTSPAEPARRRDSAESRRLLLDAARALFAERGYERTTLRDIGERAGVDAALVARYFGSKAELYSAAVVADNEAAGVPTPTGLDDVVRGFLGRVETRGVGPFMQALTQPQSDLDTRTVAASHAQRRLVAPITAELIEHGWSPEDAQLRAETVVAAVLGVAAVRHLGAFDHLSAVDGGQLAHQLVGLLTDSPTAR